MKKKIQIMLLNGTIKNESSLSLKKYYGIIIIVYILRIYASGIFDWYGRFWIISFVFFFHCHFVVFYVTDGE